MVVFCQKWLYSGCIRVMWLYSSKSGSILAKWLYSGKVVVFGQDGSIGQSGCNPVRWLFLGKRGCNRAKVVLFGQRGCIRKK